MFARSTKVPACVDLAGLSRSLVRSCKVSKWDHEGQRGLAFTHSLAWLRHRRQKSTGFQVGARLGCGRGCAVAKGRKSVWRRWSAHAPPRAVRLAIRYRSFATEQLAAAGEGALQGRRRRRWRQ